jgi:hypothetical protein
MNRGLVKEIISHPNYSWNPLGLKYSEFDYSSNYADHYYNPVMDAFMDVSEMFYIFGRLTDITYWCVSTGFLRWNDLYR